MTIAELPMPEHCPGAYVLHLYCKYKNPEHEHGEFPHEPTDVQTGADARRIAREWGWKLHRDGTATCPKCVKVLAGETVKS